MAISGDVQTVEDELPVAAYIAVLLKAAEKGYPLKGSTLFTVEDISRPAESNILLTAKIKRVFYHNPELKVESSNEGPPKLVEDYNPRSHRLFKKSGVPIERL